MTERSRFTTCPPALPGIFAATFPAGGQPILANGPGSRVWAAALPNGSRIVNLAVPELEARLAFRLSVPGQAAYREDVAGLPLPPWALYVAAVGWAWAAEGYAVPGLDAIVLTAGGIQEGFVWETGLTFAATWQDVGGWPLPAGGLLGLLTRVRGYFH
jgi:hypothetical protein